MANCSAVLQHLGSTKNGKLPGTELSMEIFEVKETYQIFWILQGVVQTLMRAVNFRLLETGGFCAPFQERFLDLNPPPLLWKFQLLFLWASCLPLIKISTFETPYAVRISSELSTGMGGSSQLLWARSITHIHPLRRYMFKLQNLNIWSSKSLNDLKSLLLTMGMTKNTLT